MKGSGGFYVGVVRIAWASLGLLVLLSEGRARAQAAPSSRTFELVYSAPAGCPSDGEFFSAVQRIVPDARRAASGSGRRFIVTVDETGQRGQLGVTQDGQPRGVREAEGASCAEVADVLAFAVALALDPDATTGGVKPTPAPPPEARPVAAETRPTPSGASDATEHPVGWAIEAHGSLASGVAPQAVFGVGGSVLLRLRLGNLEPLLRLGMEYGTTESASIGPARVDFSRIVGIVEPCVTEWRLGDVSFRPCARLLVGQRTGRARDIRDARGVDQAWVDIGPSAHVRWSFLRWAYVELGGALGFALTRDRAYFAPNVTVYEVPVLGGAGEISLGVQFY